MDSSELVLGQGKNDVQGAAQWFFEEACRRDDIRGAQFALQEFGNALMRGCLDWHRHETRQQVVGSLPSRLAAHAQYHRGKIQLCRGAWNRLYFLQGHLPAAKTR